MSAHLEAAYIATPASSASCRAVFPALTSKTAFEAVTEPVYTYMPGAGARSGSFDEIPKSIGRVVRRTDTGQTLGIVGNRYVIAPNRPIYDMVCKAAAESLPEPALSRLELAEHSSFGGQYTRFELTFPGLGEDIRQLTRSPTQLIFRIGVTNTFNGSGSIRVLVGASDLVCSNGMTIDETEIKAARHTSRYDPELFADFISGGYSKYLERVEVWRAWARAEIEPEVAQETLEAAGMPGRRVKAMMRQFETEAGKRGSTIWALYSALTYYASHSEGSFTVRKSRNGDNVAVTLGAREREIARVVSSEAWTEMAA